MEQAVPVERALMPLIRPRVAVMAALAVRGVMPLASVMRARVERAATVAWGIRRRSGVKMVVMAATQARVAPAGMLSMAMPVQVAMRVLVEWVVQVPMGCRALWATQVRRVEMVATGATVLTVARVAWHLVLVPMVLAVMAVTRVVAVMVGQAVTVTPARVRRGGPGAMVVMPVPRAWVLLAVRSARMAASAMVVREGPVVLPLGPARPPVLSVAQGVMAAVATMVATAVLADLRP